MSLRAPQAAASFLHGMRRACNGRLLALAVGFGIVIALSRAVQHPAAERLLALWRGLLGEALAATLMVLSALVADEAVRRGCRVWSAFTVAVLFACTATVGLQLLVLQWLGLAQTQPHWRMRFALDMLSASCTYWAMAMLVFLNHRSAARSLAGVRATELEGVQIEQRLIDSRLSAAKAQVDPALVMQRLAQVRRLYATGQGGAEAQLESLIEDLRGSIYADQSGHSGPAVSA